MGAGDMNQSEWRHEQCGPPRALIIGVVFGALAWIAIGVAVWWFWTAETPELATAFVGGMT